jgi:hypothetical protein
VYPLVQKVIQDGTSERSKEGDVGKHLDKLGSLEEFKAPWESDTGSDAEIDATKLKKYLYNLQSDKAKAEDAAEEAAEKVTKAEQDLKDAKAEVAKGDPTGKIAELEGKLAEAQTAATKAEQNLLRVEVATEKGLTVKQAKRLQGETEEELKADADEILEEFGVKATKQDDEDEHDEDEDEPTGRTTPQRKLNLVNPGDTGSGAAEIDYDKEAAAIVGGSLF